MPKRIDGIRLHPQWTVAKDLTEEGYYRVHLHKVGDHFQLSGFKLLYKCDRCFDMEVNFEQANGWAEPCPKCGIKRCGSVPCL